MVTPITLYANLKDCYEFVVKKKKGGSCGEKMLANFIIQRNNLLYYKDKDLAERFNEGKESAFKTVF